MLTEPIITERPAQPYVSITERVSMQDIGAVLPQLHPEVGLWLREHNLRSAGAPFWKYDVIDMAGVLEVEVGAPIAEPTEGDERVRASVIPAGRFVVATFTGHPMGLENATATLLAWAEQRDLAWDVAKTDVGDVWGARLEIYETDPAIQPDMSKWVTTLAFRLAD
jgi:effector-binding domain-containing protein